MAHNGGWQPASRMETIKMAQTWRTVLNQKGESVWDIDAEKIAKFENALTTVENEMAVPMNLRNAVTNDRLKVAFDILVEIMRDIKNRYFFVPPLTNGDLLSLGLKPKDTTPTAIEAPIYQPAAKVNYKGAGVFELIIAPAKDIIDEDKRSYYGCKIIYDLFLQSDDAPTDRKFLYESKFIRRKKEKFVFQPENSGKRMFFCMRYENSKGEAGPWSPISSVVIP